MSEAVEEVLRIIDRLLESEREEVFMAILARARAISGVNPSRNNRTRPLSEEEEELVQLAEMNFLELDAQEAADGNA